MIRRCISRLVLSAVVPAALCAATGNAVAQEFPTKPISFIVPYGTGTGNDIIARIIAQKVTESWGHSMVVDNRPGAAGAIGAELTARAAPDGHTILIAGTSQLINPLVMKVNYDILKDFASITIPGLLPYVLAVSPGVPAKSIKELVALAKSQPGKLNYGGTYASASHFMGEMLKTAGDIDIALISYKSTADAVADVIANRVQMWFTTLATAAPLAKSGKIRVLGVSGDARAAVLPDVPTMAEAGYPTLDVPVTFYILTAAATPKPIVTTLNREINKALASSDVKQKLGNAGVDPKGTTPEQTATLLKEEVARWAKVVKASGVKMQ